MSVLKGKRRVKQKRKENRKRGKGRTIPYPKISKIEPTEKGAAFALGGEKK